MARDNLLNKSTKMDLAERAIALGNYKDIAEDDVNDVRKLKAKYLGPEFKMPASNSEEDVGNIVVCDDYHHNDLPRASSQREPSRAWPMAGGIVLAGMIIAGALALPQYMKSKDTPTPEVKPPEIKPAPSTTVITKKSGFIIDLPAGEKP